MVGKASENYSFWDEITKCLLRKLLPMFLLKTKLNLDNTGFCVLS